MVLNLQQLQKQTQRLIMTPQMQQSIQLLQLNAIELEQLTQQELMENPFLTLEEEEAPGGEPAGEPEAAPAETDAASQVDSENGSPPTSEWEDFVDQAPPAMEPAAEPSDDGARAEAEAPTMEPPEMSLATLEPPADSANEDPLYSLTQPEAGQTATADEAEEGAVEPPPVDSAPEQFNEVDLDWENYFEDSDSPNYKGTREDHEEHDFTEYVAAKTSLSEYLNWQLRCCVLEGKDLEICEYLIGSLNEDGYLAPEVLQEAAEKFEAPPEQVERVLTVLQEFDPPGIGARSLPECLLIQMKARGMATDLAREVLENHMVDFQKKRFRELARKLGRQEDDLLELYHKVCRLEPHPGRSMSSDSVQYIQPDVYVKLIDGEMIIYLNEGQTGRLSVDRFYYRMIKQQRAAMTQQEREYATEKLRGALTLIKNIEKRKSTILRVTEAIMEVQRPFLEKGIVALKPLTLREVADMVSMHESTVARVTSRKYVETPQGTYPLKFFFSSSIESAGNDAVSSRSIKDKLSNIIGSENPKRPLSDQKIAEMLNRQGFDIARRTVAKYREQLKILPAKYRRQT